jgi:hypothetical protein
MLRAMLAWLLVVLAAQTAPAQQRDSTRPPAPPPPQATQQRARPPRDSLAPPISPRRAFFYSALAPGYAQTVLDRPVAGALFFAAEAAGIALAIKAAADLRYARAHARDSIVAGYDVNPQTGELTPRFTRNRYAGTRVRARRTHLEDWYAFLAFNHLIAGAEAFVSAQLWDLPGRVSTSMAPGGGTLVILSIPW